MWKTTQKGIWWLVVPHKEMSRISGHSLWEHDTDNFKNTEHSRSCIPQVCRSQAHQASFPWFVCATPAYVYPRTSYSVQRSTKTEGATDTDSLLHWITLLAHQGIYRILKGYNKNILPSPPPFLKLGEVLCKILEYCSAVWVSQENCCLASIQKTTLLQYL